MSVMTTGAITDDPRFAAMRRRDAAEDGRFVYAVRTTGVYCRPSCAARPARPENVAFFETGAEARAAGFRPCKRCRPDEDRSDGRRARIVAQACRTIREAEEMPSLGDLAAEAGLSTFHFHRLFKTETGLTPRAYGVAERAKRVRAQLEAGSGSVTAAIYDAGFNASSRFYETSNAVLGMTPTAYRNGGAEAKILFAIGECSLGSILVARSDKGICSIAIGDDPEALVRELQDRFPRASLVGGDAAFEATVAAVIGFVEAPGIGLDLPLDIRGTAFQQRVWAALRQIPAGQTSTYAEIAHRIGDPKAVRAVAGACAANTIAVAIPCHRVVRTDGSLSGYRWGVERKRDLLAREAGG
ncbi:bifunctional DNA-binding transcriptional regulator/O6-methylguanine-DNA methyltransferase Ada [Enterovirga rhinocerotis]|uniref:methylated-DNA--[protein]-cysteine S-methyltransferase n=1 Tax=Enterovirga rhinocerotis TaxID=1339210 RepID=A0A4R7C566_9HYPH|nr:bifunctional DNA-binding transcriptional regulator/O6-methylguanine-DNA methyltransferase Ada [Enterovirga rhinocerotis]TDR93694.1 DNA-O6-methylguanine--protein-cysteine S-methyltransferase /transcriptional regulator Ada [Enterovirga rhinocerotis]